MTASVGWLAQAAGICEPGSVSAQVRSTSCTRRAVATCASAPSIADLRLQGRIIMRTLIVTAAVLAGTLAATPALALAEGQHYVRNETGEAQSCTIRHAGSNYAAPIVLR